MKAKANSIGISRNHFLVGGMLIAIGITSGLILIEIVLRIFHLSTPLQYQPNSFFGWAHTPNFHVWYKRGDDEFEVRISPQGLRDVEHSYVKDKGTFRILVLGDSFSEAIQVPLQNSYPRLLEEAIQTKLSTAGTRVEVINAGTSGYGTDNELLFLKSEGFKYSPDLVLLQFCICNDVRNNWYELENVDAGGFRKPYFVVESGRLILKRYPFETSDNVFSPAKAFLNEHVRLYPFLRVVRDRMMSVSGGATSGIPLDYQVYMKDYPESWTMAWHVTSNLLSEMKKEVTERGARLFVVIVPTRFQVRPEDWRHVLQTYSEMRSQGWDVEKPNRLLQKILEVEEISYVDLLVPFRRYSEQTGVQLYLASDGHWSQEGHRLASEILMDALISQSFVPGQNASVR